MAQLMVRAQDSNEWLKGMPTSTKDNPNYGGKILPDLILLNVTDATRAQLDVYLEQWKTDYRATEPVVQAFKRVVIAPNQANSAPLIGTSEVLVEEIAVGVVYERGRNNLTATVEADVQQENDTALMDQELYDKYDSLLQPRRWTVNAAYVDSVVAAGGKRDLTLAELQAELVDAYG